MTQAVELERVLSSKNTKMHIEFSHDDIDPSVKRKMSRSSSSSSSSAASFHLLVDSDSDDGEMHILNNSNTKSGPDSPTSPRRAITLPEVSAQVPEWSAPGSASPKHSPPVQTMGRPDAGYEPNRLPSSIFSSKPPSPLDWSVASNESLFSIHMGNNSFSRDQYLFKSGELISPDELSNFTSSQQPIAEVKSDELNKSPSSLPAVVEVAPHSNTKSASMEDSGVKEPAGGTPKMATKETAEDPRHFSSSVSNNSDGTEMPPADSARASASPPRFSNESGNSSSSFAFPVLIGETGRSSSVKVAPESSQPNHPEKPQSKSQPQEQAVTPKAAQTRWFSCFSCCPLGC